MFFFAIKEPKDRPLSWELAILVMVPPTPTVKKQRPKGRFTIVSLLLIVNQGFLNYSVGAIVRLKRYVQ